MFKKFFGNEKFRSYLFYVSLFILASILIIILVKHTKIGDFLDSMENKTFDLRQSVLANSGYKKPSKDIVVITVDNPSYEYLLDHYGEWPIPREVYANIIDYVEKQQPRLISFDLMFIKSLKSKTNSDMALVNAIKKHDNVYVSMNFDDLPSDVRTPVKLDKKFASDIKNESDIDFKNVTFSNCRAILPGIMANTKNVGLINVSRSDDGILRKVPPFVVYQDDFYPYLALLSGMNYLKTNEKIDISTLQINKNRDLKIGNRTIPIDKDGGAILNWYGPANSTYTQIPMYKIIKAINGEGDLKYNFKNKIVYVGVSATSLYDIKSVPVDKLYPGVFIHATFINNLLDNNFIRKVNPFINLLISLILGSFIGYKVMKTRSTTVALGITFLTSFGYIILAYFLMKYLNLWVAIILPITFIALVVVAAYIAKYLLKSRDFDYQYKLATTDGLTELFNHRYFQEQMVMQVENCKRYNSHFSLILIDIDFFKKFNDVYGHQSGDAVLKQVAAKLKKNVRATDIVCRYGGEEMTIVLPNTDREEAIFTAEKLCQLIAEKPFKLANEQESNVTISLGVSTYPQNGESPSELIAHADERLYKAKENGRNQVGL